MYCISQQISYFWKFSLTSLYPSFVQCAVVKLASHHPQVLKIAHLIFLHFLVIPNKTRDCTTQFYHNESPSIGKEIITSNCAEINCKVACLGGGRSNTDLTFALHSYLSFSQHRYQFIPELFSTDSCKFIGQISRVQEGC